MIVPRPLLVLAAVAVVLTGCSGDDAPGDTPASPTATENVTAKPEFEIPDEQPPDALQVETLAEGEGDVAEPGDTVTVHYVGKSWSTGEQFDASWDREQPFVFELGAGNVIPGWEQGIEGMTVGERRMLVIPPDLAYGEQGVPGAIEPGETLVFVVDLLDVEGP
ncbi:MAG: FKBP-type peptidyl-prolyl cis-trans isomerase [Nitriliruptorales bacterium]|nr:FKBP-type peptidyl-prolyl cis-trans isomerase [Nitriliruptorales bacterium]